MAGPGGFFSFSQKSYPVHLGPGGTQAVPAGNYIANLGRVSVLQWFDGWNGLWRNIGGPFSRARILGSDGANYRIVNFSGIVQGALITNAGTAGTNGIGITATGCSIGFGAAPTAGRVASAYPIIGGSINTTITITTAGTGLVAPPLLVFDPPPAGGIAATAYCTLSSGGVGAVTVTNPGAGYTAVPICNVIPQWNTSPIGTPAGNDAPTISAPSANVMSVQAQGIAVGAWTTMPVLTVNATLGGSGTLTGIVMMDYGANYLGTAIPTISFTGGPTSAAATAVMAFSLTSITQGQNSTPVSVAPIWQSSGGLVASNNGANEYCTIIPAYGTTALTGTSVTTAAIEGSGFGLQKVPAIGYMTAGGTVWVTNPSGTAVAGGIVDTSMLQPAAAAY